MSKDELLEIVLDSMAENDLIVDDQSIAANKRLIDQVFMLAGVDDKIHVSQYDENIETARLMVRAKEQNLLN